jgi:hypothetical protein
MAIDPRLELVKTLRATPIVAGVLVHAFADDRALRRRPAVGEWAAVEVVAHLADTEERALTRVRRMITEDEPVLEPFDQVELAAERDYLGLDAETELRRLTELRTEHLALLESLDDAGWQRVGIHGEHGRMTVERYETHVAAEEVDHLAQLARLLP